MDKKPLSPPQEKTVSGKPDAKSAKKQIATLIQQFKIPPQSIIQIGKMAEQAMKDRALYPMLKDAAIKSGMMDEADFGQGFNEKLLGVLVTLSRATEKMMSSGELRG